MIPQRIVRKAVDLAAQFKGQPDRLRGFLQLSRAEQAACFPGHDFGDDAGADWPKVCELALCYAERRPIP